MSSCHFRFSPIPRTSWLVILKLAEFPAMAESIISAGVYSILGVTSSKESRKVCRTRKLPEGRYSRLEEYLCRKHDIYDVVSTLTEFNRHERLRLVYRSPMSELGLKVDSGTYHYHKVSSQSRSYVVADELVSQPKPTKCNRLVRHKHLESWQLLRRVNLMTV